VDFIVVVPRELSVAANGRPIEVQDSGFNRIHHWRHSYPISTYLVAVAVNTYEIIEDQYGDTYLHYYAYPQLRDVAAYEFGRHGQMLKLFNEKFGAYPFDSYGSVLVPAGGWAMENQTMTFYSDGIMTGDRRYEQTVAHELAHHWWGDSVTLDDYRHIWLNEGFASFAQIVWAEYLGGTARAQTLSAFRTSIETDDQRYRHSLYRGDYEQLFSLTVYRKGGYVLHMLRWELGDEDFFEGLRTYHERYKFGTAVTDDFQDVMEEVSGRDLDGFFDGWVYGAGWPRFAISSYEVRTYDGTMRIITVRQTQDDPTRFAVTLPIDPDGDGPLPTGRYYAGGNWAQFDVPVEKGSGEAFIEETDWLLMETESADYPVPSVSKIKGRRLRAGRNGRFTLTGENFTPATRVFIDSPDVTIRKIRVSGDGTEIKVRVRVASDAEKSKFGFRVVNPDGNAYERGKGLRIVTR
jgi:aminopeptidase N